MTSTSGTMTNSGGTITLLSTATGSYPKINITGAQTLTSGGFTWPGAMTMAAGNYTVTFTASSTWTNSGLTTFSATTADLVLTPASATLVCAGGLTLTTAMKSTSVATIDVTGGTLGGNFAIYGPLDIGTITVGAAGTGALTYNGVALTLNSGATLTGTGTLTLTPTATTTLTSNGATYSGALSFNFAGTFTLVGNWINTGLVTYSAAANVNQTTNETLTANGGVTMTSGSGTTPTATIILGGGTWSGNNNLYNNLTLAGNSTISGTVAYHSGTLTYSSGIITVTGSTLVPNSCTLNTSGMTWNILAPQATITLTSNINTSDLNVTAVSATFTGAFNITTSTLEVVGIANFILAAGQTLNVTSALTIEAYLSFSETIKSGTALSSTYINYTGNQAKAVIFYTNFTDVSASGPPVPFYGPKLLSYNSGTLTRTQGIVNVNASNINKKAMNSYNGV